MSNPEPTTTILEEKKRLSESLLWQLQRSFYDEQGVRAWHGVVPWFITNNAHIANAYAAMIMGFVQDQLTAGKLDAAHPVHVVEMGAGSGRFAFLCLKKLQALRPFLPPNAPPIRYIMTDFTQKNINFWRTHPFFKPFIADGLLDFALFDAEKGQELVLQVSGETLTAETLINPTVAIANYVFDTIVQDAFRVESGHIKESLLTLHCTGDQSDPAYFPTLKDVTVDYTYATMPPDGYYPNSQYNKVLYGYAERLGDTAVSFPIGALRCLDNLIALTRDRLCVLTADKGYNHEHELLYHRDPQPVEHGSFSLSVNYHAIIQYMEQRGGLALHTSPREASLVVCAFISQGQAAEYRATHSAFAQHIENFGPIDFFALQDYPIDQENPPPLSHLLALVRLSGFDPHYFYTLSDAMAKQEEDLPSSLETDLIRTLERVWENFYPMGESRDVAFELGRQYYKLHRYPRAMFFYEESVRYYGTHHITLYNMGLCQHKLNNLPLALDYFQQALAIDEGYGPARNWRLRVEAEMGGSG